MIGVHVSGYMLFFPVSCTTGVLKASVPRTTNIMGRQLIPGPSCAFYVDTDDYARLNPLTPSLEINCALLTQGISAPNVVTGKRESYRGKLQQAHGWRLSA